MPRDSRIDDSSESGRADREKRLDDIVAGYLDRLNDGESLDPRSIAEEHPDHAAEILDELSAFIDVSPEGSGEPARHALGALGPLAALGDYKLLRRIGRGGMGVVYEAWENSMDRRVALKVLPAGIAADDRAFHRFLQEAKTAGKLSHPNLVPVYATGVRDQTPYFAMEYVEGETLAQVLAKLKEAAPESETVFGKKDCGSYFESLARAFADVADGLQHAHSHKIIHRDIKPSNLILDGDGRLRVLDFGLARLEGQEGLTQSGDFLGTPLYMSPEQARRQNIPIDYRTDIYSLGATLYEMLTLGPPFRGKDHADTLSQIIERDPSPPTRINPRVPRDLETIVLKCLRKEPVDRYGTAEALGQDLRRFVRADAVEARAEAKWEKMMRRVCRHRLALTAGAVLIALLGLIGWLAGTTLRERRLRALADYRPTVLGAIEKLQAATLNWGDESGEPSLVDPGGCILGQQVLQRLKKGATDQVQEAVRQLGDALASIPEKPEAWYYRAQGRLLLGDLDGAIEDLDGALRAAPGFVPALVLKAGALERHGQEESAQALREKARGTQGEWQKAWLIAHQAMRERRWEEAAASLGSLILRGAEGQEPYLGASIASCLSRAGSRLEMKDPAGALQDLAIARYLWPRSVEAALLEGKAYYLLGDLEKAEATFQRTFNEADSKDEVAIAVEGIFIDCQEEELGLKWAEKIGVESLRESHRAECLLRRGRCGEGIKAARRAIELDPGDTLARLRLGNALYDKLDDYQEALEHLEEARKLSPRYFKCQFDLGRYYFHSGKMDQAAQHWRRAIELNPTFALSHADLGLCLIFQGRAGDGLRLLDKAVEIDPRNPWVRNDAAFAFDLLGKHDQVLETCEAAIRCGPRFSWPHALRGQVFEKEGKFEEAIREFRIACPLTPRGPGQYQRLGRLLEAAGKVEEAIPVYMEALELDPTNVLTHFRIARILKRNGVSAAGTEADRLSKSLDCALEKVLSGFKEAEPPRGRNEELVRSLVWLLSSLESIRGADESLIQRESVGPSGRAKYLEAQLLRHGGHQREAAAEFTELLAREPFCREALLGRAAGLRPSEPARAEKELRQALVTFADGSKEIWDLWAAICLADLHLDPERLLADLPDSAGAARAYSEDLRWLLAHLRAGEALRINCGGEQYVSPNGTVWSSDRFFTHRCGTRPWETRPFLGEIADTDEDPLYQSQHPFPEELPFRGGYRFPLPPGRYRISLHFAEVYWRVPGARRFDVRIEGSRRLESYEPLLAGFATASVQTFVVPVDDGLLDLEFVPVADVPAISAIEIERVD